MCRKRRFFEKFPYSCLFRRFGTFYVPRGYFPGALLLPTNSISKEYGIVSYDKYRRPQ